MATYPTTLGDFRERIVRPYYVINAVVSPLYLILRALPSTNASLFPNLSSLGSESQEYNVLMFAIMLTILRIRKAVTLEAVLRNAFTFFKMASTLLFYVISPVYGTLYALLVVALFFFIPQPMFQGHSDIRFFTAADLQSTLKSLPEGHMWLIEFYAPWSGLCTDVAPVFAELTRMYTRDHLHFGKVDVSRAPAAAAQYGINTAVTSREIPTFLLFGADDYILARRPIKSEGGRVVPGLLDFTTLAEAFDLAERANKVPKPTKGKKGKKND